MTWLETQILKKVWLTFINHNFGLICVCIVFFFNIASIIFSRFHTNGYSYGTTYFYANHGRFLSFTLVYRVKKDWSQGMWGYIFDCWYFKKSGGGGGGGEIEIKQILQAFLRKSRVCLCVSARALLHHCTS